MKRLLVPLLAMLAFAGIAQAQPIQQTVPRNLPYGPLVSSGTWCTPENATIPYTAFQFTYTFPTGAPNAVTMTVSGSQNGRTFSSLSTGSTTTGGSISISGVYAALCITATTLTGSGVTVTGTYAGVPLAGTATVDTTGLASSNNQTNASQKTQIVDGSGNVISATSNHLDVNCAAGCTAATTDTDDGTVAGAQVAALDINLNYVWNGSNWVRLPGTAAGSGSAVGVLTVQGHASGTPIPTNPASVTAPVMSMNSGSANAGVNAAMACNYDDAAITSITENNFGFWRCSANRNAYTTIRDAAGNERGANVDASNRLTTAPTLVSGSVASGAIASGAIASGAVASGAVASGAFASGAISDGADVTFGSKADAKSTATDTTAITAMQVFKEMSFQLQAIAALASTDPCAGTAKTNKTFAISSATTTVLVAASASNKLYVCSFSVLPVSATDNFELVEDATGSCASPDAGIIGGTADTTGANLVANQGIVYGSGAATVASTASTNVNVCLITSTTAKLNGNLSYVLAP